ncbi:Response regulator containing CheY-like receiver domain and AraC-type DNA-binding domain [Paenibacillus uliginis N3/975]|uniref:Response regulator containing CheY-like receiver domain and AraC-type DNA-binding domain n=1 Tax=Paenibacillus uliginis N3/975 TaxID=1313296 RepID=A0A1X7G744_9BACL|nr:helix-turn-helix domain-containing protein [Paenibacillus uliginis]SMF65216.1 Response regulator containing CheY-like receiver domain and AraC-type DNA-binding domain [Paenibacillus uliginis N3/975]
MKWKWLRQKSFVFRIYVSFLVIILLFSVFNLLSVHLFSKGVQNEIIQYNRMMLKNTAERYQTHFERVKTLVFDIYSKDEVVAFNHQIMKRKAEDIDYRAAKDILKDLRTQTSNPMFYLNNLVIHFDKGNIVLEKEGSLPADMMFTNFYVSKLYPASFWKNNIRYPGNFLMHSESDFQVSGLNDSNTAGIIPVSFHMPSSHYQVIAFLDAQRMNEAFYDDAEDKQFMILKGDGSVLYRTAGSLSADAIPEIDDDQPYRLSDGYYFFEEKDTENSLTYVTAVSSASIAARVRSTNWNLVFILTVSVIIGLLISMYFIRGIHRPIKQFMASILHRNPAKLESRVHEFDLIHQNIRDLMLEKESIHRELQNKQSLLTSFGYINKLKAIVSDINEWKDIADLNEPFFLVLYQLHFKAQSADNMHVKRSRMAYYIHEYINVVISESIPGSHTLQIENNQIISLIRRNEIPGDLDKALSMLKERLDHDRSYVLVTIGISSIYPDSSEFNEAYTEVLELVQHGRPVDETQIIRGPRPDAAWLVFTMQQEHELYANLQAGNAPFCISFIDRMLDQFNRKEASIRQLRRLGDGIITRVMKILEPFNAADKAMARQQMQLMMECCTLDHFKQYFSQLFDTAAAIILTKKEEQDPIISYVMDYIENRVGSDISLDQLAESLNLSAAYLSVYIKEKTGANFSEHFNTVRIRKAKDLLSGNELSIQEISLQLGYSNVTSFNRMFKKMTGMPPGEYRKREMIHTGLDRDQMRTLL